MTEPEPIASAPMVGLAAVILAATLDEPRVLTVPVAGQGAGRAEGLPAGPLEPAHPTLERGLRAWVERQTGQSLGYVEQLYTFGDRNRRPGGEDGGRHALSVAYLALVREARPAADSAWQSWYRYFPYEDWRAGRPPSLDALAARLEAWAAAAASPEEGRRRLDRIGLTFGAAGSGWNEERVLERYELLFEAGLVPEAGAPDALAGQAMAFDHRRMLATALGRLRGKIKYRPVVFELMPPAFTLGQLQRVVEALSGVLLHKQNFRRLVAQQGLVEETEAVTAETGGRPARLMRFRREVLLERPAPGLRLPSGRAG
ncbi:membrane protein [Methylobacterium tarhaniae]|uniref:Membrane protein n=1 Tax=Methylobacterium tarhaniae TaxID=1187852 RepID=A0A0J6S7L9_9HYPH|nr:membrane protein [Methylobacterium tarhaniae]KMO29632.1 membrane protein [Methylobacterium tarhaniae]